MTTRERAHALLDQLSDAELDKVLKLLDLRNGGDEGPATVELPGHWEQLPSGAMAPWVAAPDEQQRGD